MKRIILVTGLVSAFLALSAVPASAAITLVNGGFETGTTAGWTGSGFATSSYQGYTADSGSYFGVVTGGCYTNDLEQQFTASAGDTLKGAAFFKSNDYMPYDDNGDVRIVVTADGSSTVLFSSSVAAVGGGGTPWTNWSYTFEDSGTYKVAVRSTNKYDCSLSSALGIDIAEQPVDADGDGLPDTTDNCPTVPNPGQANNDGDSEGGDVCDADDDNDNVNDSSDNCQLAANEDQANNDGDSEGDVCDADDDNDTVNDSSDNCQFDENADQADADGDGKGTACDPVELPKVKDECKNGGWRAFHDGTARFKNQGDCVSFVATGGENPPAG